MLSWKSWMIVGPASTACRMKSNRGEYQGAVRAGAGEIVAQE
jgi:hypothetical protein